MTTARRFLESLFGRFLGGQRPANNLWLSRGQLICLEKAFGLWPHKISWGVSLQVTNWHLKHWFKMQPPGVTTYRVGQAEQGFYNITNILIIIYIKTWSHNATTITFQIGWKYIYKPLGQYISCQKRPGKTVLGILYLPGGKREGSVALTAGFLNNNYNSWNDISQKVLTQRHHNNSPDWTKIHLQALRIKYLLSEPPSQIIIKSDLEGPGQAARAAPFISVWPKIL